MQEKFPAIIGSSVKSHFLVRLAAAVGIYNVHRRGSSTVYNSSAGFSANLVLGFDLQALRLSNVSCCAGHRPAEVRPETMS